MNLFDVVIWSGGGGVETSSEAVRVLVQHGAGPLIVLTDEIGEAEKVALIEAGADYCLNAAIAARELSARIGALASRRKTSAFVSRVMCVDRWIIDITGKRLIGPDLEFAALTPAEFDLLHLFIESQERVLPRPFLLDRLGKNGPDASERTMDVYVSRLRHKLRELGADRAINIRAVWNEGYVCRTVTRAAPLRRL